MILIQCIFSLVFQVSETENLRKNLAVERMIVEGCDILLDVNQVFVRQGKSINILSHNLFYKNLYLKVFFKTSLYILSFKRFNLYDVEHNF